MKTKLLIILFALSILFPISDIFAPPSANPDWTSYPYCPGGCPRDYLIEEWAKYYDMKGEKWMEQKRLELFDAYENGILYDWIDSDPTKANQNVYTYYYILGEISDHDGEFFILIPSCNNAILVSDDALCSTDDFPPCPEPSFRKNGLCVIEKKSICGQGTILKDNQCIPDPNEEFTDEQICGPGTELIDGICMAVLTDKTPSRDCIIATASYGSELAPQVQMLREVRDNVLLSTDSGVLFMEGFNTVYYSFSPEIAQLEEDNPMFKEAVKIFITPMVSTLSIMTLADEGSEYQVILFGISTISLIVGMYVVVPTVAVNYVWRKRK